MNSVIMIGRLTKDPELRFIAGSGKAVANLTLAVNREFSKEKEADFFRVIVWGKQAENVANFLGKGRKILINGNLQNNNYEKADGTKVYGDHIIANRVEFLDYADKDSAPQQQPKKQEPQSDSGFGDFEPLDDSMDVPF